LPTGEKYEPVLLDNVYKITMRLTIRGVTAEDYGSFVCLSKNSLGETDGHIKLYRESKEKNRPFPSPPFTHLQTLSFPF
jgi:hypothetical protein